MHIAAPPESVDALLERARQLAGRSLAELAHEAGADLPSEPKRAKGFIGTLVEACLGASAGNRQEPDFPRLGVELKTLPVDAGGRPRESTFVTSISLLAVPTMDFEDSPAWHKLRRVLFVPIEADHPRGFGARRVGASVLFEPDDAQTETLRDDWERFAALCAEGDWEAIDARLGTALQVRPKAAHGGVRTMATDADGGLMWETPRGCYLRPSFTAEILARGLG